MPDTTPDPDAGEDLAEDRAAILERITLDNNRRRAELLARRIYVDTRDAATAVILAAIAPTPDHRQALELAIARTTAELLDAAEARARS